MSDELTLNDVQRARQRIASCVRRTPLAPSAALSERLKTNVYVKLELFQKTGSFKVRGTFNKALSLAPEIRARGLVTVSGGNHALAVAYTGRALDLKATVLMPQNPPAARPAPPGILGQPPGRPARIQSPRRRQGDSSCRP